MRGKFTVFMADIISLDARIRKLAILTSEGFSRVASFNSMHAGMCIPTPWGDGPFD